MSIDQLLEERFRHVLAQEQWIPSDLKSTSSSMSGGGSAPLSGGGGDRKWVGCLLLGAAVGGLLAMWFRRQKTQ